MFYSRKLSITDDNPRCERAEPKAEKTVLSSIEIGEFCHLVVKL